jgi:hypothetical protein
MGSSESPIGIFNCKKLNVTSAITTNQFQDNGTGTVTISNVAPAGVGTPTISKWLTIVGTDGITYYIPAWT